MKKNLKKTTHDVIFGILSAIGLFLLIDVVISITLPSGSFDYFPWISLVMTLIVLFFTAKIFASGLFRKVYVITSLILTITPLLWELGAV